jgi:hypothetical protein
MGARGRFIVVTEESKRWRRYGSIGRACKLNDRLKRKIKREEKSWNEKIQKSLYADFKPRLTGVG